jgi:hypothetical protein
MTFGEVILRGANEIRMRLSERIRSDFARERTVKIDGWLLALAEVRLCALAVLHDG